MKRGIFLISLFWSGASFSALPTTGYVSEYFSTMCHNPNLTVPGVGGENLASNKYLLELIDNMNRDNIGFMTGLPTPTTYADEVETDSIISLGYLNESIDKLSESMECCLGGEVNPENGKCEHCDIWSLGAGAVCPTGYNRQALTNVSVVSDTASCPSGTEVYYHIPNHCMGAQYVYSDESNDYDNNIGLCIKKFYGWGGATATTTDDIVIMTDNTAKKKVLALGQARGTDNRFCHCRITHLVGPNGYLVPYNGPWVFISKLYQTNCSFQCAFYSGVNNMITNLVFGGRFDE